MKKKKTKKRSSDLLLIVVFFVGLSVLLYPSVSNYYNSFHESRAIASYQERMTGLSERDYTTALAAAKSYNRGLAAGQTDFVQGAPRSAEYASLLRFSDDGMMGYITIKKLDVELPIYHGTSDGVLAAGAGHLEGSSLPVGGESTHTVLTGHRGLPSAKLFTDLDRLETGDTFALHVMDQTLYYRVDQIRIVLPGETQDLQIASGKDYCTLVTCTPYGVNTHRLLVRGVRTSGPNELRVSADAVEIDPAVVAPFVAAPVLLVLLILLLTASKKDRRGGDPTSKKDGD